MPLVIKKKVPKVPVQQQRQGLGFFGALTILFIGLKLTHVIAWSWLWVFAPLWWFPALFFGILLIIVVFGALHIGGALVIDLINDARRARLRRKG